MKKYGTYLCAALSFLVFSCHQMKSQEGVTNVDSEKFNTLISNGDVHLIDVRTPKEFREAHIEQALNVDFFSKDFSEQLGGFNSDEPVYIYCRSGKRSGKSVAQFQKAGFKQIYNLDGGILGWISAEFPVVGSED